MAYNKVHYRLLILFMLLTLCFVPSLGDNDPQILMKFKSFLSNADALNNWGNESIGLCQWTGVLCPKGTFRGLQLEGMGLTGVIDIDTLGQLSNLFSFSVINNSLEGPMPEFKKLGKLRGLYLSNNRFSGTILDDAFKGMKYLQTVSLAENGFTGPIPKSLAELPTLSKLELQGNSFEGNIPEFQSKNFKSFNCSYNQLVGPIPEALSNWGPSSFTGNKDLCGKPLTPCKVSSNKKRHLVITAIVVVAGVALAAIVALLFIRSRRRRRSSELKGGQEVKGQNSAGLKEAQSIDLTEDYKKRGDLHFVKNGREMFDLQELLGASAEILGSGSFGSTYKAIVSNGSAMVVKRFRHMNNVGKEEFCEHMNRLGRLTHPNLLPLVAFYYRKDEKLLVYDFVENGSLASHLHGRHGPGLDWATRLKIIKGVARGLAYLYKEFPDENLPHGHLKSSNVLLDHSFKPYLTEYGFVQVMNKSHAQQFMAAYKAPEVNQFDRPNERTDVWCLGILILELLTGRFPANYLRHGKGANADLSTWVNSVVREEWTGEVFDKDILGARNGEGEMLKLLKIGMYCCEWGVENRWGWREAVAKIEELKERDSEDEYSYASEGELYSRTLTEDECSFTISG